MGSTGILQIAMRSDRLKRVCYYRWAATTYHTSTLFLKLNDVMHDEDLKDEISSFYQNKRLDEKNKTQTKANKETMKYLKFSQK